jgi:hypothetical protein
MEIVRDEPVDVKGPAVDPTPVAKYNPEMRYRWNPSDKFTVSGGEFGVLLNAVRTLLNTPEAKTIFMAQRASDVLERLMQEGVESGKIVEDKPSLK